MAYIQKKSDVYDATGCLERIDDFPEPEVEGEGYQHNRNHDQASMPAFRDVVFVIENRQGSYHVGQNGRRTCMKL